MPDVGEYLRAYSGPWEVLADMRALSTAPLTDGATDGSARRNFINLLGDRLLSIEVATTAAAALDSSANRDSLGNAATAFRLPPAIPIFRETWLAVRAIALAFSHHQKCSIAIQDEHTILL